MRISFKLLVRLEYARTTPPYLSSGDFYRNILTRGLRVINEELQTGKTKKSPLRLQPYPEDMFDYAGIGKRPEDIEVIDLEVNAATLYHIHEYLKLTGQGVPDSGPLAQKANEALFLKGLDDLGQEAWEEAEKHRK